MVGGDVGVCERRCPPRRCGASTVCFTLCGTCPPGISDRVRRHHAPERRERWLSLGSRIHACWYLPGRGLQARQVARCDVARARTRTALDDANTSDSSSDGGEQPGVSICTGNWAASSEARVMPQSCRGTLAPPEPGDSPYSGVVH